MGTSGRGEGPRRGVYSVLSDCCSPPLFHLQIATDLASRAWIFPWELCRLSRSRTGRPQNPKSNFYPPSLSLSLLELSSCMSFVTSEILFIPRVLTWHLWHLSFV